MPDQRRRRRRQREGCSLCHHGCGHYRRRDSNRGCGRRRHNGLRCWRGCHRLRCRRNRHRLRDRLRGDYRYMGWRHQHRGRRGCSYRSWGWHGGDRFNRRRRTHLVIGADSNRCGNGCRFHRIVIAAEKAVPQRAGGWLRRGIRLARTRIILGNMRRRRRGRFTHGAIVKRRRLGLQRRLLGSGLGQGTVHIRGSVGAGHAAALDERGCGDTINRRYILRVAHSHGARRGHGRHRRRSDGWQWRHRCRRHRWHSSRHRGRRGNGCRHRRYCRRRSGGYLRAGGKAGRGFHRGFHHVAFIAIAGELRADGLRIGARRQRASLGAVRRDVVRRQLHFAYAQLQARQHASMFHFQVIQLGLGFLA